MSITIPEQKDVDAVAAQEKADAAALATQEAADIASLKSSVSALQTEVTADEAKIASNAEKIAADEAKIAALQTPAAPLTTPPASSPPASTIPPASTPPASTPTPATSGDKPAATVSTPAPTTTTPAAAAVAPAPALGDPGPLAVPATGYAAVINIQGKSYLYDQAAGKDEGDVVLPFISQNAIRIERSDCPIRVIIRRDTAGANQKPYEFVIENFYADLAHATNKVAGPRNATLAHTGSYTVDFYKDGVKLATKSAANHWTAARWRYPNHFEAPRPLVRAKADLDSANLILWLSPDGAKGATDQTAGKKPTLYVNPMDTSDISVGIAEGGERPDIGPVTEWQARWLINQDADSLAGVFAWAEAFNSYSICYRDEVTGAPVDNLANALNDVKAGAGAPTSKYFSIWPNYPAGTTDPNPWNVRDISGFCEHPTSPFYLPFLLTDDPYFLESLQFNANALVTAQGWQKATPTAPLLFGLGSARGTAWLHRESLYAEAATKLAKSVPSWLLPASYFGKICSDNAANLKKLYVDNLDPTLQYFRTWPRLDLVSPWMEGYELSIYAIGVMLGHPEYMPLAVNKLGLFQKLIDGVDGWNPNIPVPYEMHIYTPPAGKADPQFVESIDRFPAGTTLFKTMADAWNDLVTNPARNGQAGATFDATTGLPTDFATSYRWSAWNQNARSALGCCVNVGVPDAARLFGVLDALMVKNRTPTTNTLALKYSTAPKSAA